MGRRQQWRIEGITPKKGAVVMAATATRFSIEDGPSKFDLMAALFDGKKVIITLRDAAPPTTGRMRLPEVYVRSVEIEDGSRESWLIKGWCSGPSGSREFTGYFDSRTRKGWMEFLPS